MICGQCQRWLADHVGFEPCPQGAKAAVRIASAALAAAGGHPVWIGDGRPRWLARQ